MEMRDREDWTKKLLGRYYLYKTTNGPDAPKVESPSLDDWQVARWDGLNLVPMDHQQAPAMTSTDFSFSIWFDYLSYLEHRIDPGHHDAFTIFHPSWNPWWDVSSSAMPNWQSYFHTDMIRLGKILGYFTTEMRRRFM